jgi:hypothetical protein
MIVHILGQLFSISFLNFLSNFYRGSTLALFITDGDPEGDIKKTVKELLEFNSKGVEICTLLAQRYWEQLYAIFKNKSDPFFP